MSFDDILRGSEKAAPHGEFVEGSFQCGQCWEIIFDAEYFPKDKKLVYRHDDHETIVEGISL